MERQFQKELEELNIREFNGSRKPEQQRRTSDGVGNRYDCSMEREWVQQTT